MPALAQNRTTLRRGRDRSRGVLIVTPQFEPALAELTRLLGTAYSVDVYSSDAVEVQGARTAGKALRFYWFDPLLTMFRLVMRIPRYRLVVNYYHRNGYWLGLLGRVLCKPGRPTFAWVGFAPNPRGGGISGWLRETVTYSALLGHDLIICNTRPVIARVKERYPKVASRVAYARWGGTGDDDVDLARDNGYIFSGGRTNRDFTTLVNALSGVEYPAVIVASSNVEFPKDLPGHIAIHRDLPPPEFQRLLRGASVVVVPLKWDDVSSGQVVLNRAMRSGKAAVISATAGIDEYVTDGEDAVLVAPGDADDLMTKVKWLLDNPDRRAEIGRAARRTYEDSFNSRVFASNLFELLRVKLNGEV